MEKDTSLSLINKETLVCDNEENKIIDIEINNDLTKINKKEYDFVHDFIFTDDMKENAKKTVEENTDCIVDKFLHLQARNWDKFYKHNTTNFFKDRHYILAEFPELKDDEREKILFLDIGCGVGNSFYPLMERKKSLFVKGFDISAKAVEMAKTHSLYDESKVSLCSLDIVKDDIPLDYQMADYGILMFVLSAIMPESHFAVLTKIYNAMKEGGILYFRDYGRYDMAQIRFSQKKKNKIEDNLYIRFDKTLAFFFDQKEIEDLFIKVGFKVLESKMICRLIENRKDNKKMHRLWLQLKLQK